MIELFSYVLSPQEFALLLIVALLIGFSKAGVHGSGMAAVPLLALVFGGKNSSGLLLPILCIADAFAVWYYHRHANWKHLLRLFPWAALGVITGTLVGDYVNDDSFRTIMALIIFTSLCIMIWQEKSTISYLPKGSWFAVVLGLLGGFTTMVGNLAGSVMALYLLTMRLPKYQYIGTAAWFFMVLNLFKIPFHVFVWKTITMESFLLSASTIPAIILGAFLGIAIIKKLPEHYYRWFIIGTTGLAAVLMIL